MSIAALKGRTREIILSAAVTLAFVGGTALCSRPSDVREREDQKASVVEDLPVKPGLPEVAAPTDTVQESGAPPASSRPSTRSSRAGTTQVGSQAAPLVAGIGQGVTNDSIKVGFLIVDNNQKMLSNYGVRGGAIGDTKQQVDAVVSDLNARGGILGRKIVPVFRTIDATSQVDQYPSFCAAFTQDEKVFAVLSPWNAPAAFPACLAKAGTLFITDALTQEDQDGLEGMKPYVVTGMMNSSRAALTLGRALHQQGYFAPGAKVGIIRQNTPTGQRVNDKYFKPYLASIGVTPADETTSGTSTGQAAAQRFQEKQITHVIFITSQGGPPLFFMNAAQTQAYFPRYGIASPDGPAFLAQSAPHTQLQRALGAGWQPGFDVLDSEGPPFTPSERRCLDVHKKAGTDYGSRNEGAFIAMVFCDLVWLLEEAGTKAGRTLNVANWSAALATLGSTHQTTTTFTTNFEPGVFDGAVHYRNLYYDDSASCRCFKYTGPLQTAPR